MVAACSSARDPALYISHLEAGKSVEHQLRPDFGGYRFVVAGGVTVNGQPLDSGQAAIICRRVVHRQRGA